MVAKYALYLLVKMKLRLQRFMYGNKFEIYYVDGNKVKIYLLMI